MTETDPCYWSIDQCSEALRDRVLSPVELLEAVLARAEQLDKRLGIFITRLDERARKEARAAEQEIVAGRHRGPLHGVPVTLKDLYDLAGIPTTCGSAILAGNTPDEDATCVARLRAAGAIVLGKVNLHEFAFGTTGINPHYGTTRNPWNPARIPGGSSGGSAVAVATGIGVASLGTDTGGSIRLPAALCGTVGLKPTYGRVSRHGVFPLSWSNDHVGPLTRSVKDAAHVLEAMAGHDSRDPTSSDRPSPALSTDLARGVRRLRAGVLWEQVRSSEPEVASAFKAALEQLARLGLEIVEIDSSVASYGTAASLAMLYPEAAAVHRSWLRECPERYGADVRQRLELAALIPAVYLVKGYQARARLREAFGRIWQRVDVVLTTTVPVVAPPIEDQLDNTVRGRLAAHTRLFNVLGGPSCSVPCGFTSAGLPVGLLIGGRDFDERTVLRVAHAYEQATEWHLKRPPV